MDVIEICGTVLAVQDAPNGTFFWVETEAGRFEQLYSQGGQFDFVEVGAKGVFLVDGLPIWNPCRGNWGAIPRILTFQEGDLYSADYWDDDDFTFKRTHEDTSKAKKGGKE